MKNKLSLKKLPCWKHTTVRSADSQALWRIPQGLNAMGESDLKIYYEKIGQLQETYLRPALEKLLPVLEVSAIGYFSPDSEIVFEPIATTTPAERVTILSQLSASVTSMVQAGLITKDSALAELRSMGREVGAFSHLEPAEDPPRASAVISPDAESSQESL